MAGLPHFDEGVLSSIFGVLFIAQHAKRQTVDVIAQAVDQPGEGVPVASSRGLHQLFVSGIGSHVALILSSAGQAAGDPSLRSG